jgi:hypothetical protein
MADDNFQRFIANNSLTAADGGDGKGQSVPILKVIGITDSKGPLEALSVNGAREVDGFSIFRKTKMDEILKSGHPSGSSSGNVSEICAPALWVNRDLCRDGSENDHCQPRG